MNKELLNEIRERYEEVWAGDTHGMVDYCVNEVLDAVKLHNGIIYMIDKKRIKKTFCFGYGFCGVTSQEEEDAADNMAMAVKRDVDYFIEENMKWFTEHEEEGYGDMYIERTYRNSMSLSDTICYLTDWEYADTTEDRKLRLYKLNDEDKALVKATIAAAKEKHLKKVQAYLKRYGLSKVRSWSFLMD